MYYRRFIVGLLLLFGLIFLVYFAISHIFGGSPKPAVQPISLPSYANTSTVMQFTIDGPVNYDGTHREIRITVGQNQNSIAIIQGYQGNVLNSNTYPSNQLAYNEFLHALALAGFTKSQKIDITSVGACATGNRYYLQIIDSFGNYIQNLWGSSCNEGTYAGPITLVESLFEVQIPDYSTQTSGVGLD